MTALATAPYPANDTAPELTEAEDINRLAFGFMASKALFAALHVGLFDRLAEGPADLPRLVAATGVGERRLLTLLTALAAVGLVTRDGGRYANSAAAQAYLVQGASAYFGDYLKFQIDRQMYPFLLHLNQVLDGRRNEVRFESYADWMDDPDEAALFSRSQHAGSLGPGAVLGKRVDLSGCRSLLDVGGGTGAMSIMLCKRYPEMTATVLDFPNVVSVGKPFVDEDGMTDRVLFHAGNALDYDWPGRHGAVLMSYLFGGVPEEEIGRLAAKAFEVLDPGGVLIIHDFMVEDDRSGPPLAALWALQHMVYTPRAVSLTPAYVAGVLEAAGFEGVSVDHLIPGMTRYAVGRKPG